MKNSFGQATPNKQDTVTSCFHIVMPQYERDYSGQRILAFSLQSINKAGNVEWTSKKITSFENDEDGYYINTAIPSLVNNTV